MPFSIGALNNELLFDNSDYERHGRSDLHALVELLYQVPAVWTAGEVATEMKRISATKWLKYARTRSYLVREIPTLTDLLRAIPTGFRTVSMSSQMGDMILRHNFRWKSDTGNLQDLAMAVTRERVSWPQWPPVLAAYMGQYGAVYVAPGHHTGMTMPSTNLGQGQDDHQLLGPFNQTIFSYRGGLLKAPMEQVYEYSYDRVNWLPIPGSNFSIVREVTGLLGGGRVQISIIKTNLANPADRFVVKKLF